MPQTALVTGANGFTGSYLCRKLVEQGHTVRALVRHSSKLDNLNGLDVELVYADLAQDKLPEEAFRGVDTVYHVAAMYRHEGTEQQFYDTNMRGVEKLLNAALATGVGRFVHCSTVGVLGNIENPPADETAPYAPGDWYQKSKMEGEKLALDFGEKCGLPVTVVRPGAIYGPGDMRFLKLFRSINRGRFMMLGSGEVYYHYVYVEDLADGFILAAQTDAAKGQVFIVAGEEYATINRIVQLIAQALGRPVPKAHIPIPPAMLAAKVCRAVCEPLGIEPPLYPRRLDYFIKNRAFSIAKAKRMLGYNPKVDLPTGLARTAQWYRANGYL